MAKLAAATAALETYCGFPAARTRQVSRRLLEEGLLEPGAPFVSVEIDEADFALLLLAVASGASMPRIGDVTSALAGTVPNGVDVDIMPEKIRPPKRTAFDILHHQIWNAARNPGAIVADLDVVETWVEAVFHLPEGVSRFQPVGSVAGHWQGSRQRRSTRVPGSAIALAAKRLFGEKS